MNLKVLSISCDLIEIKEAHTHTGSHSTVWQHGERKARMLQVDSRQHTGEAHRKKL